ncbi:NADH-quinone oxidoreductase subunit L [Nakamurella sp. YIM 132087]|uniref:NADH-quinone oxidoreductase subunit L n=1 Tax=Nakamurella alba TaxID=2665158 RepID=A0A7K1FK02_9ACTN|nr:NADH-quinone oxidoreductase subunit L [Nakamurella alba]
MGNLAAEATAPASGAGSLAWLLLVLPLAGAAVLLLGGRRMDRIAPVLGCLTVLAAFVIGLSIFLQTVGAAEDARRTGQHLFTWFASGSLDIGFGLLLDPLSLTFVLLITGVGFLIHVYSIGYMAHDPERRKFFAYLNLFVASMLLLVLGDGFVTLYFGWEGVGVASYLLIGFWSDRRSAATAAKKAFLMNRVGDVGLALAIFLMFSELGTTSYEGVFAGIGDLAARSPGTVTAMALLLLLGACGKSGQVPLQAWLPDAMEGPTPVSALIHAATMVTAGVYLIARSYPVFDLTATGRLVVAIVGAVTLLLGCIAGCAKDDIKKVLAYSTVSQIGYMFLAVGLGAGVYALGILHLLTHGFFKAGLFLGAGSVMHGMNDDVDMRRYGGLARRMPITFVTMGLGYLALIGFPFLSGYFSKDPIIEAAFAAGGTAGVLLGGAALLGAGLTAFYMTRLMIMTFFGPPRWQEIPAPDGRDYHPHESPPVMTVPMIVLAVGSLGAGAFLAIGDRLQEWLSPSLGAFEEPHPAIGATTVTVLTLVMVALGIVIAWLAVGRRPVPLVAPERVNPLVAFARADAGGNVVNETLVARPGLALGKGLLVVDGKGVDGAVNGVGTLLSGVSRGGRRWQNGFVRSYALSMLSGTVVVIVALLAVRFS